jgi:dihydrofolate reductase
MRKIIGGVFLSLDGVVQGPGGPTEDVTGGFDAGGWVFKLWDKAAGDAIGELFTGEYGLLLGRRTYDIFAAYWPYVEGEGAAMGEAFTRANKYVLTRGDQPLEWANSHRLKCVDDVAALKRDEGPDLIIQGSSTIYPGLLAARLIDRLMLITFPVMLGKGKRLFGDGTPTSMLKMVDHKVTTKGTVIATYEPGATLPAFPPFAPQPSTSSREAARQRRMAEGSW